MQELIDYQLQQYLEKNTSPEPPLLREINRQTYLKVIRPRMLSGHYQGRLLAMFSKIVSPKFILEIGTYTAYSAICLAEGLDPKGKIITIDDNEELAEVIIKHIAEAGLENKIEFINQEALSVIPDLDYTFDLIFIDADKQNYGSYYDLVIDKTRAGGLIIIDNVLWSGKVLDQDEFNDKTTLGLADFNQKIQDDKRVDNILLPVRDGLMLIRKI
ncbi:MAG: O-methyltransferase [Cyclobacteriaceae bacterium]